MPQLPRATVVFAAFLLGACTTHVTIESSPPGARVRIDGVDVGTTPAQAVVGGTVFETHEVELSLDGYQTQVRRMDTEGRAPTIVAAICLCPLFWLWAAGPREHNMFVMQPLGTAAPPPPPPPPSQ